MPDLKTLMYLYLITNAVNAGAVAIILSLNRGRFAGILFWLIALALQVVGSALLLLRGMASDLISMTLANAIILAGLLALFMGLERFTGKKSRQAHNYVLLAIFIASSAYFAVVQPNLTARDTAVSTLLMIYAFQCCRLLLRKTDPSMRSITRLTGIVFAVYAAFSFARLILNIIFPAQSSDFFQSGAVNALTITGGIVLTVCLTFSLVLMVNRRLLADVKAQEEKFATAFRSSPFAITLTRPSDGAIFEVNEGFVINSGYQYAEVIGKTTLGLNLWLREEDRLAVVNELAQGREIQAVEYQFRKKTGEVLTGLFSASLVTINNETCILSSIGDITERKRGEEALQKSEERYRLLIENVGEGVGYVNPEEQFVFANAAAEDIFGVPPSGLLGRSLDEFASPEQFAIIREQTKRRRTGEKSVYELEISRPNGEKRNLLITAVPQFDSQGKFVGAFGVFRDITERKRAEEALREANERLLLAIVAGGVGIWDLDVVNNKLTWDDQMFRLYGITPDNFDGAYETWKARVHPEDVERGDAEVQMALRGEKEFDTEFRVVWPNGAIHHICARARLYCDAAGQPTKLIGTNYDITERKQAEDLLKRGEQRLRNVINGTNAGAWEWNVQTGETAFDEKSAAILGYSLDEFQSIGFETWMRLKHPEDMKESNELLRKHLQGETEYYSFESRMKHKDGHWVWVLGRGKVIEWDENGKPLRIFGTHLDITDRKRAEEALRESEEQYRTLFETMTEGVVVLAFPGWPNPPCQSCGGTHSGAQSRGNRRSSIQ
ncbi:MAG: PAS domain S-box protein [Coprothermobacterota bacterium]|nr:PAS domain S-box protein [Coprothermobacterota bacterium]